MLSHSVSACLYNLYLFSFLHTKLALSRAVKHCLVLCSCLLYTFLQKEIKYSKVLCALYASRVRSPAKTIKQQTTKFPYQNFSILYHITVHLWYICTSTCGMYICTVHLPIVYYVYTVLICACCSLNRCCLHVRYTVQ